MLCTSRRIPDWDLWLNPLVGRPNHNCREMFASLDIRVAMRSDTNFSSPPALSLLQLCTLVDSGEAAFMAIYSIMGWTQWFRWEVLCWVTTV